MTGADPASPSGAPVPLADFEPPPPELLEMPLDYIFADHFRQRVVFGRLRRIATERSAGREEADAITKFLSIDLPLHLRDEDEDLFPVVQRRARAEDNLEPILSRLHDDHRRLVMGAKATAATLAAKPQDEVVAVSRRRAQAMLAYVADEQRHLSIENGIVLVIARKRLTTGDLQAMGQSMKARRGMI